MIFEPYPTRSGFFSLGVAIFSGAILIFLLAQITQQNSPVDTFELLAGLVLVAAITGTATYWTVLAFRLQYQLNRNGLAIQWGLAQQLVPFDRIEGIISGQNLAPVSHFRGLHLAGLRFGRGESDDYGPLKFHTTTALTKSLVVVTPEQAYVISPRQPDDFIKAWQARQRLGPTQQWAMTVKKNWPLNVPLLNDPLTWWLWGAAGLVCLMLFGYFARVEAIAPPAISAQALKLSTAGAALFLFNIFLGSLVYRYERIAAYLLWGSSLTVQICLIVAVYAISG